MEHKRVKEKAAELLGLGLNKQQVLDQLRAEFPERRPKKLAEMLRWTASPQARDRYKGLQQVLLACIVLGVLLRIGHEVGGGGLHWESPFRLVPLIPFASAFFAWGVYHWHGHHFAWVGWMNVFGALSLLRRLGPAMQTGLVNGAAFNWTLAIDVQSALIGVISLYLYFKVFPKFKVEKDPMGGKRYVFPEEGAGMPLR